MIAEGDISTLRKHKWQLCLQLGINRISTRSNLGCVQPTHHEQLRIFLTHLDNIHARLYFESEKPRYAALDEPRNQ